MASQGQATTTIAQKLEILRNTVPFFCQNLIPAEIVPKLGALVDRDLRNCILEKERAGQRKEGVKLLLDKVIAEGERGMNIFLSVLQAEGADPGWPKILKPLENMGEIDVNEAANEYYEFIVHLLEGDIIAKLTEATLQRILIHLYSTNAISEYEYEGIKAILNNNGTHLAAVQMFTLLGMRDHQWPQKFFLALREEDRKLYEKIVPNETNPIVDKESSENGASGSTAGAAPSSRGSERAVVQDDREQTEVKQPQALQHAPDVGHAEGPGDQASGNLSEEEKEITTRPVHGATCSDADDDDRTLVSSASAADTAGDDGAGIDGAHFSDDEKQDTEGSEKHGGEAPRTDTPKELTLRDYQHELARVALQGLNTIICAPTGSGKTRVALHIVQQHLQGAPEGRRRKVVFLARTVPLVSQQHRNFKDYLPQYNCELVTGESENSMTVHHQLDKNDILVLTPKILENHLTPEKIPSLSAFSLIIFDECHHTRKGEPYNSVMKHYLKSKKEGEPRLPQIVGLTASIGVEKATTADEAKESILSIMGNLDVIIISQVRENLGELGDKVPRPVEELATLVSRENDDISNKITNVMLKIEEELTRREQAVKGDSEVEGIRCLLSKRETDTRSQKFGQWAVNLRNQARLLVRPETPKDQQEMRKIMRRQIFAHEVQVLSDWLVVYNEAFDVHNLTRPEDVLHYLERKSTLQREQDKQFVSTELDKKLLGYFSDVQKQLQLFSRQENPNPNLVKLGGTILSHIDEAGDDQDGFRILLFVRTRATCRALCDWMNSKDTDQRLRSLKAQHFTGTGAHQEHGGMTPYEQVETLKRFKQGDVKLLVTTSVGEEGIDIAECNLTIRYNHVGNEVTTVQTRGRSRKKGGRSILMAMSKIIEQEELNRKREQLMHAALELIRLMPRREITEFVQKVQTKALQVEEIDQIMKQVKKLKKKEAEFSIACPQCYKVKVNGAQIRGINNAHRVIIGHDIDNDVIIMPGRTILKKDDWEMRGAVICKCKKRLGQLLYYKKAKFILVSPKYWVFLDKDGVPAAYKKWTSVPHHIEEVSPEDIMDHLGIPRTRDDENDDEDEVLGAAAANV